uniref:Cytochrome P450, family 46, subfamily A, polypeptide 1 n=1 Tax=Nothobranchius furzeri TaxID=105023 RepID=A0A8C6KR71_NOTFU
SVIIQLLFSNSLMVSSIYIIFTTKWFPSAAVSAAHRSPRDGSNAENKFRAHISVAETYGPVCRINILHWIILCITCPEATKEILMSHKYPKTEFIYKRLSHLFGQRFLGNGLLTALDHGLWHKQRRLMNPAFYNLYLSDLMEAFNEKAEDLMGKLADEADNNTVANFQKLKLELNRHNLDYNTVGVRKEVDDVIGMKYNISYEDLGKLTYLSQVLKETLRLYPTAPAVFRKIPEDTAIDGLHVPGGVSCIFDNHEFRMSIMQELYLIVMFTCLERIQRVLFFQMEAKVVMVKLVQRFDFTLAPGQTFDIQDSALLGPKNGVFCFVKHRK